VRYLCIAGILNIMKKMITLLKNLIEKFSACVTKVVWQTSIDNNSLFKAFLIRQLRILFLAIGGALENKIFILAPALTFFSALSIVPAAALALGMAKGFGLERYLEQQLQVALAGREAVLDWVIEMTGTFFNQIDGGVVAIAGLGVLIYTIFMLLAIVEKIFNQIWMVRYGRTILQRFRDYSAVIILGPLLLIAAGAVSVFISTSIQLLDGTFFSPFLLFLLRLMPYMLIWMLFTLLYKVMPNTRVNALPALITGILAGTAFQLIQWAYLTFQIGAAGLGIVYGSFATVPLLLIWMQVSWMVVLFGAELAHAAQNIELYRYGFAPKKISPYRCKLLSLSILSLLLKDYRQSSFPLTENQILDYLKIPGPLVKKILNNLKEAELITVTIPEKSSDEPVYFKPALDIYEITVAMALEQLELYGHAEWANTEASPVLAPLEDSFREIFKLIRESEANRLLVEL
jgi:membrane protein